MKKNVLARKILCGLLAAGVVGACGSVMAAECNDCENHTGSITGIHTGNIFNLTNELKKGDYGYKIDCDREDISILSKDININVTTSSEEYDAGVAGADAWSKATLTLGNSNTENITIKVVNNWTGLKNGHSTLGLAALGVDDSTQPKTILNVNAKKLNIDVSGENAFGVYVGNTSDEKVAPDNTATMNINADSIEINSSEIGIGAFSNGQMNINGNLIVNAKNAIDTRCYATINVNADGKHKTVLNGDIVFETPATPDDKSNSSEIINSYVNVNLNGSESSWTGSAYQEYKKGDKDSEYKHIVDMNVTPYQGNVTGFKLNVSNGATWNMTGDSFINNVNVADGGAINVQEAAKVFNADKVALDAGNINVTGTNEEENEQKVTINDLTSNDGTINMQGSEQNITVVNALTSNNTTINLQGNDQNVNLTAMSGSGATVNTNSLDNSVNIGDKASETKIAVHGSSAITDQIATGKATLQDLANVVGNQETGSEISLADTVTSDANDIIGGYSAEVGENGKIVAGSEKTVENTTNRAISDMASISLMTWRQENNDMNKRLGELRDSKGEHGAWARMARGESKYGSQNVKNQYNYYQVGYDEKLSVNPNWTVGVALTRTEGNSTFAAGSGENKHTGFAVYGSYLNDNGSFIDLIAKYARMDNEYKTIGAGVGDADYETNGYSISAEYGKRFTKDNGSWIEPQVELTYGTVGSANYTTSKGNKVYQESVDSLVARLGFALGKNIKQGNIYARASYLYDFDGETKATMTGAGSATFEQDLGGGWWEVGVGTNINLSDATHLYFDVEKTYGGNVATPWQWNAGVRWSF